MNNIMAAIILIFQVAMLGELTLLLYLVWIIFFKRKKPRKKNEILDWSLKIK